MQIYDDNNGPETDRVLVMSVREAFLRAFSFPGGWSKLRVGFWARTYSLTNGSDNILDETLAYTSPSDRMYLGITANQSMPGTAGAGMYCGLASNDTSLGRYGDALAPLYGRAWNGATQVGTSSQSMFFYGASAGSFFTRLEYTIQNKGASNQQIALRADMIPDGNNPTSLDRFNELIKDTWDNTEVRYDMGTFNWNNGSAALEIPSCLLMYLPLITHRLVVKFVGIKKFA